MVISAFDLFKVGIGPSSSHTVGPMRAAREFVAGLIEAGDLARIAELRVDIYGSLAATGRGHGTFPAVLLGLEGYDPETVQPNEVDEAMARIISTGELQLGAQLSEPTVLRYGLDDLIQHPLTVLERHSNGMRFAALAGDGTTLRDETYFSIGGGFVEREGAESAATELTQEALPYPFETAEQLLAHTEASGLSIPEVMFANELIQRSEAEVRAGLANIWQVMEQCKDAAILRSGNLPGGLNVPRRAPEWHRRLREQDADRHPRFWQEWLNLVAIAVNEENASGGRVVTAPTNGAAGIIPAALFYATHYAPDVAEWSAERKQQAIDDFLLTAAAIGVLYKKQASISGAEVGCQGEVGSAASMAAGALAQVLGGTPAQVENAAEIAMEHHLGLTCDPIGGLVQIPCIERNAVAACTAVNAAKIALMGDGSHYVTLDEVIVTMRETGRDMSSKYKETSRGGLAVNVVEC